MPVKKTKATSSASSRASAMSGKPRFLPPRPLQVETETAVATTPTIALGVTMICATLIGLAFAASIFNAAIGVSTIPTNESNETVNNVDTVLIPSYTVFKNVYGDVANIKYFDAYKKSTASYPSLSSFTDKCLINIPTTGGRYRPTEVASCVAGDRNCRLQEGFVSYVSSTYVVVGNWPYSCPNGCSNGACNPVTPAFSNWKGYDGGGNIVMAGSQINPVFVINFQALNNQPMTIEKIAFKGNLQNKQDYGSLSFTYKNSNGASSTATAFMDNEGYFKFTGLDFYIPADKVTELRPILNINRIEDGAKSGHLVNLSLVGNYFQGRIISTGQTVSSGITQVDCKSYLLRKSNLYLNTTSLPSSILSNGVNTISKFFISAGSSGNISWKQINLKYITSNPGITLSNCKLISNGINIATTTIITNSDITVYLPEEEVIIKNNQKVYEIKCNIDGSIVSGNSLSTKIDGGIAPLGTTNTYTNTVNAGEMRFVWSDQSGTNSDGIHNATSNDWCDSNSISNLPTSYQTLVR